VGKETEEIVISVILTTIGREAKPAVQISSGYAPPLILLPWWRCARQSSAVYEVASLMAPAALREWEQVAPCRETHRGTLLDCWIVSLHAAITVTW